MLSLYVLNSACPILAAQYSGALRVGSETFGVALETIRESQRTVRLEISVTKDGHPFASATSRITPDGGILEINGRSYPLSSDLASRWWSQITDPQKSSRRSGSILAAEGTDRLFTRGVQGVGRGFPAKAEVKFDPGCKVLCEPTSIRVFSLGEWDNGFHDYVSLGMIRRD